MATADPEFVAYMRTQNFTVDDATDVAERLSVAGLYSASDFLGFCNTKGTDMYRWWADQADWRTKGNILARLRHVREPGGQRLRSQTARRSADGSRSRQPYLQENTRLPYPILDILVRIPPTPYAGRHTPGTW